MQHLGTLPAGGLNAVQVAERQALHGLNQLPVAVGPSALRRFLAQFHNILIYVLLVSAAVTASLGHPVDTAVIVLVVLINALIGFVQEGKAQSALDAIRQMLPSAAMVLRAGHKTDIDAAELVPGDWVFLNPGDKVPADLRLVEARGLRTDESALTGESVPVDKHTETLEEGTPLAERGNMAYSGTWVVHGQGSGVVVATGVHTELGRITGLLEGVTPMVTPLLRQFNGFAQQLTGIILLAAVATVLAGGLLHGYDWADMFLAAVGLAVAAIPEGLPAIVTITLAIGVQRMARRKAIVRRLPAVESLGAVTVVCTDKTGTLTRNEMTAQALWSQGQRWDVSGVGYAPHGGVSQHGQAVLEPPGALLQLTRAALLCNDAVLHPPQTAGDAWRLVGDPTEGALVCLALKLGLDPAQEKGQWPRTDVVPFDADHRFMATLHHNHRQEAWLIIKGAPERVLGLCDHESTEEAQAIHEAIDPIASDGMRLLAVAARKVPSHMLELNFSDVEEGGFELLGVVGLSDPPRPEAIEAVKRCRQAGLRVKMITGDHASTAAAIGRAMGLSDNLAVLTGPEIERLTDGDLRRVVQEVDVYARSSPEHKLRLVQALQANGEVVAMTGDGVNDAPALKRADVGVAMGQKGTEAAKDAAEMVLADDNFASIAAAVEEGRAVYDNIRKSVVFALPTNGGEAGMLLVAVALGLTLPITPVQILWVNMLTAVTLALSLAFEVPESDLMQRPPRPSGVPLLTGSLVWRTLFVSGLLVGGCMGLFSWALQGGASLEAARTLAVNALIAGEMAYLINVRHLERHAFTWEGLVGNVYALLAIAVLLLIQLGYTYLPFMQTWFSSAPLEWRHWWAIAGFAVTLFGVVELEKGVIRWVDARRQTKGVL